MSRITADEARIAAALAQFGWACTPEFWQRYHSDAWVFNLVNAVDRLASEVERLSAERERLERTLRLARFVADHWRRALLDRPDAMAHPLCMVLAALDGETDPLECGIDADEHDAFAAALSPDGDK